MSQPPTLHPSAERNIWSHVRLVALCAAFGAWALLAAGRLYYLQVEKYDHYVDKAEEQQRDIVELDEPRGTIYDRLGRELAVSMEVASVVADPLSIHRLEEDGKASADEIAFALAEVLGLESAEVRTKLESPDRRFVWIRRKVDRPVADRIEALKLPGVHLLPESKRYYPLGSLAAQLVGYVGTDNQGLAGLEAHFNPAVSTEKGLTTVLRDGRHGQLMAPGLVRAEARPGDDLHLTIDSMLQHMVERELRAGVESSGARGGQALMLDPRSGAILAIAALPTYDPNDFRRARPSDWRIPAVHDAFEPGSTFKMVTLAAALESGQVDPLVKIDCGRGLFRFGNSAPIHDHKSFDILTVREVIAKSSNVGAIHLGRMAGAELLYSTIQRFGFGKPTNVDLPAENAGQLRPLSRWAQMDPFYISFGQGISVTSLQLANAFAAIANGGDLLRPFVVERVGNARRTRQELHQLVAAPSTVRQVRTILEQVVIDGTATAAALEGYRAAGKTGTAQKFVDGSYVENRYVASFVGFAPVEDPALVLVVVLDEPWPRYHGGEVAAPIFRRIAQDALLYLGVRPHRGASDLRIADDIPEIRQVITGHGSSEERTVETSTNTEATLESGP